MSKKFCALAVFLSLAAGTFGGLFSRVFTAAPALAQGDAGRAERPRPDDVGDASPEAPPPRREAARADARRWEYCAITRAGQAPSLRRSAYSITYFLPGTARVVDVEESFSDRAALPKAIAKLGDEGWELVGEGPLEFKVGTGGEALYFKRRKP